jgi:hypothetical protein
LGKLNEMVFIFHRISLSLLNFYIDWSTTTAAAE